MHRRGCDCHQLHAELVRGRQLVRSVPQLAQVLQQDVDTSGRRVGSEASVVIFCRDRRGMLVDVSTVVTGAAYNILDVNSETHATGGMAAFQYTVQLEDTAHLEAMVGQILQLTGVTSVLRSSLRELKRERSAREFWALAERGAVEPRLPACAAYDESGFYSQPRELASEEVHVR